MKTTRLVLLATLWGIFLSAGCGTGLQAYDKYNLGPAKEIAAGSVESMGGLSAWQRVSRVRAGAVVTSYDSEGKAYVNRQELVFDVNGGKISSKAQTPQGIWRASIDDSSHMDDFRFSPSGFDPAVVARTQSELSMLVHRLAGPLNLLGRGEHARSRGDVSIGGDRFIRVGVDGDPTRAIAYYFEPSSSLLKYVTAGADRPPRKGTVTIYTWMILPDGMAFPRKIEVVEIGEFLLVGDKPVMEAEFSDVQIEF